MILSLVRIAGSVSEHKGFLTVVPTHTKTPFAPHKEEQNEHPQNRGSIVPRPSESANAGTRQFCLRGSNYQNIIARN
jgi:hypothetical protein